MLTFDSGDITGLQPGADWPVTVIEPPQLMAMSKILAGFLYSENVQEAAGGPVLPLETQQQLVWKAFYPAGGAALAIFMRLRGQVAVTARGVLHRLANLSRRIN